MKSATLSGTSYEEELGAIKISSEYSKEKYVRLHWKYTYLCRLSLSNPCHTTTKQWELSPLIHQHQNKLIWHKHKSEINKNNLLSSSQKNQRQIQWMKPQMNLQRY